MEIFLFKDLLLLFAASILILLLGYRLRIPPIVGFLLTGVIAGPHGLGIAGESNDVETLAQIGIVLLLFGIGMEFSLKKIIQIKRLFFLGGALQVGLTIIFTILLAPLTGHSWSVAIFFGFLLSMSSTAIVMRLLEQRGETASPHGKLSVSVLIFQDVIAIPMILSIPILGSEHGQSFDPALIWTFITGIAVLLVVFFSAERLVPGLLHLVAKTRNKELFLLTVLTLCFGVAWLTSSLGLSLTIGAFLAGLILSESEYSNEALSHIFPFQALFISFFFVSIGMLLDIHFLIDHFAWILVLTAGVVMLKTLAAGLCAVILGFPIRTSVMAGVCLCQIGEFSFVLAKAGLPYGLITNYGYQLFLAVALLTLALSPMLIHLASYLADLILKLPLPARLKTGVAMKSEKEAELHNHIIIMGFGISGRNLARSSHLAGVPYVILEMNPDTVKEEKAKGEPIHFGDASHPSVLEHLHIRNATAVAVLINDPIAARRAVQLARELNPEVYIIVRTRYVQETTLMRQLGADEAIPDEFGTSIEIFSRVLRQYYVPETEINEFIDDIRADGYELLRNQNPVTRTLSEIKLDLAHVAISSHRVSAKSTLIGKTLSASNLRSEYGLTVLLIRRQEEVLPNPGPETLFTSGDIVVVMGDRPAIKLAESLF